jgi:tRNA 2-selenouridine synthase
MTLIDDYRRLFLDDVPLLDVRAPVEFVAGAFPASTNIALLDDDERHRIGICYKQQGQQAAIDLGHQLVAGAVRDARLQAWRDWAHAHPDGALYCFRGGLRSQTVQQWLHQAGVEVPLVKGGYKALRRYLLDTMETLTRSLPWVIVCGRTGCGKTRVIEALDNSIDLEALAHHRGSAFGRRPGGQPSQIDFENRLAIAMLRQSVPEHGRVVLEDESRLIGRCHLPVTLQDYVRDGARVLIEEDLDSRIEVTLDDYVIGPLAEYQQHYGEALALARLGEELLGGLDRIQRRLGGVRHRQLRDQLEQALSQQIQSGDSSGHRSWIRTLLRDYYDPMYDYMLQQRRGPILFQGRRDDVAAWLKTP